MKNLAIYLALTLLLFVSACGQRNNAGVSELKSGVRDEPVTEVRSFLIEALSDISSDLPEDCGYGITMTSIYIEGDYVVYRMMVDESIITIPLLKLAQEQGEFTSQDFIEDFTSEADALTTIFLRYLIQGNMGLKFIFGSENSPETMTISVSPSEVKRKILVNENYDK